MKHVLTFLFVVSVAVTANAQRPLWGWEFDITGTGNLLDSPPRFSGTVVSGEPLLVGSPWEIVIPDDGWPTDPVERLAYVAVTFFEPNYKPDWYGWTATFWSTPNHPYFVIDPEGADYLGVAATASITIFDFDFDGVIDPDEFTSLSWSVGLGCYRDCGRGVWASCPEVYGDFVGSSIAESPDPYAPQAIFASGGFDCMSIMPVESMSWGAIKAMYR